MQFVKQKFPTLSLSDAEQRRECKTVTKECLALLFTAVATAQAAEISVVQAKRVQTELQSQLLAVEAGEQLEAVLAGKEKDIPALKVIYVPS